MPLGKTWYLLDRRVGGLGAGLYGMENLTSPGFDLRAVHSAASRCLGRHSNVQPDGCKLLRLSEIARFLQEFLAEKSR
jgi:hypothetical protein